MNWNIAQTLWDLIAPKAKAGALSAQNEGQHASDEGCHTSSRQGEACERQAAPVQAEPSKNGRKKPEPSPAAQRPARGQTARVPMQQRYDELVIEMKKRFGIRVRKWRKNSSGCAWEVHYSTGSVARLIEAPYPRGPMSCAIFLHEIGHHAIGFRTYRPRCLEEYHAWKWSLDTMRAYGLNVTAAVQKRMDDSLRYAVAKAQRRGLRGVPPELVRYTIASGD